MIGDRRCEQSCTEHTSCDARYVVVVVWAWPAVVHAAGRMHVYQGGQNLRSHVGDATLGVELVVLRQIVIEFTTASQFAHKVDVPRSIKVRKDAHDVRVHQE